MRSLTNWMRPTYLGLVLAIATSLLSVTAGAEERLEWDQAKMVELSQQLAESMSNARQVANKVPGLRNETAPQAARKFLDTMRSLERSTRQYASRIKEGAGYDDTLGVARRISTSIRDAQVQGKRFMTSDDLQVALDAVVEVLLEISPYYGIETPLMPDPRHSSGPTPNAGAQSQEEAAPTE